MTVSRFERFRRNHAIEHAAMHQLGRSPLPLRLVARSDWDGFVMYGHVDIDTLTHAVHEGLRTLQTGHPELAVHPRCGTNMAAHLLLAGAAYGIVSSASKQKRQGILPMLTLSMISAVAALGQPLGRAAQAHLFTSVDLDQARVVSIRRYAHGSIPMHRVTIAHE